MFTGAVTWHGPCLWPRRLAMGRNGATRAGVLALRGALCAWQGDARARTRAPGGGGGPRGPALSLSSPRARMRFLDSTATFFAPSHRRTCHRPLEKGVETKACVFYFCPVV